MKLDLIAFRPEEPRQPRVSISASARRSDGDRFEVLVRIELEKGVHLYADPAPEGFEPLSVAVSTPDGAASGEPSYPEPKAWEDGAAVYDDVVDIVVPVTSGGEARQSLEVQVRYQACTDQACFLPKLERLLVVIP